MTAYLIVRAEVAEADRDAFDTWYETEHLPQAQAAFHARSAWRGWSEVTPEVHMAFYEFPSLSAARAMTKSEVLKDMVAEFDRLWSDRVPRTREIIEVKQFI